MIRPYKHFYLLPPNRARRLRRNIVHHAVHGRHLFATILPTLAIGLVAAAALTVERAHAATPTPTSTPVGQASPTPIVCPSPSAPSGGGVCGEGNICWNDTSNNEDGFRIDITRCGTSFHYQVPADTTLFALPAEVTGLCCSGLFSEILTAFNACGQAALTTQANVDCLPAATNAPTGISAPRTGSGSGSGATLMPWLALAAASFVLITGSLVLNRVRLKKR